MTIVRKLDYSAVTVQSRMPVHSKTVPHVYENFELPILLCWSLP
jgi:hypothetical protein